MSLGKGCSNTFGNFVRVAYDAGTTEPFASRFKESAKAGDREKMIDILLGIPCIRDAKISESYRGKDDGLAMKLYKEYQSIISDNTDTDEGGESRACSILTEALFAASAGSRLFLDALLDCARFSYNLKAFAKCMKYCECMLALPASFYDKAAENADHFRKCKEECVALERESSKHLGTAISAKKNHGRRNKHRDDSPGKSRMEKNVAKVPEIDGKQHSFLESCSDAVTLNFTEEQGRHLVATRNIKAGTVLIVDQPFSFSTNVGALQRNCLHCHDTLRSEEAVRIPCRHCQAVSFCSEKCREQSWRSYHRYECPIFGFFMENHTDPQKHQSSHLPLTYRTTVLQALLPNDSGENASAVNCSIPVVTENFLRLHSLSLDAKIEENNNTGNEKKNGHSELGFSKSYSPRDYRTVLELETHCADTEPNMNLNFAIEAIFLAKCLVFILKEMDSICTKETIVSLAVAMLHHLQAINYNAYEVVENVRDKTSHVWEPRYVGGAIYPTVSLVNHSCYPNVVRHSYPRGKYSGSGLLIENQLLEKRNVFIGTVVVRATRFIGKGSEILDCYGPHFLSEGRLARREYLWKKYRFLCACQACTHNWQIPLPETMNYICRACSTVINTLEPNKNGAQIVLGKQCPHCREKIDSKKLASQLSKSIQKRVNAIKRMYEGRYEDALPLLLEHIHFIEKFIAAPNIETIKTQQCIIQCYNNFGCISQ